MPPQRPLCTLALRAPSGGELASVFLYRQSYPELDPGRPTRGTALALERDAKPCRTGAAGGGRMDGSRSEQQILDRELVLHRELLAIARLRHIALRQGRLAALYPLRTAEGSRVSELRGLEAARPAVGGNRGGETAPRIAAMIRRLGSVERANRALLVRHIVRSRHLGEGVAVLMASA